MADHPHDMTNLHPALRALTAHTPPREISGASPLDLDDPETFWIVTSGEVTIFGVLLLEGQAQHLHSLFTARTGDLLFGAEPVPDQSLESSGLMVLGLRAVGVPGTTVVPCPSRMLASPLSGSDDDAATPMHKPEARLDTWIETWIDGLWSGLDPTPAPDDCSPAPPPDGQELSIVAQSCLFNPEGLSWVRISTGTAVVMGRHHWPGIPLSSPWPLTRATWLLTLSDTTIETIPPHPGALPGGIPPGQILAPVHHTLLTCVGQLFRDQLQSRSDRLESARMLEQSLLTGTMDRLAAVLHPGSREHLVTSGTQHPLAAACELVGKAAGIAVELPRPSELPDPESLRLEDIARFSGFRTREVALENDWWTADNGPLLARLQEDNRPVALLPRTYGGYRLHDPMESPPKTVDAGEAARLAPRAWMFYKPFPDRPLTWRDLAGLGLRGCGGDLATVLLTALLGALLGLFTPIMTGFLINTVIPQQSRGELYQIVLLLSACAIATFFFNVTKGFALVRLESRVDAQAQAAIWDRILSLPANFFRDYTSGDLANRSLGIQAIRQILSGMTINAVIALVFASLNIILLFYYDAQLALIALGMLLFGMLTTGLLSVYLVDIQQAIYNFQGKLQGIVLQFVGGIGSLRTSGAEDRAFAVWARTFAERKEHAFKARRLQCIMNTFQGIFPVLTLLGLYAWYFWHRLAVLSIGDFMAFSAAFASLQGALLQMVMVMGTTLHIIPIYRRLQPILQAVPEIRQGQVRPGELDGSIEIDHLSFRYDQDGPLVLSDVTVSIAPREFVAFVGWSGSGKSTLLRCLLGFEQPSSGSIAFSGKQLDSLDIREVRRQIGVVLQDGKLLAGSILDNIVGSANLSQDDAWEALRMVNMEAEVRAMPMGLQTVVSPGGDNLSGGQQQRLLIARAIIRRPRILFFDEATSALDNKAQAVVSESLSRLNVTRIVVAHRLSTIVNADRIHVLMQGKIQESGTYSELMAAQGTFHELVKRQIL